MIVTCLNCGIEFNKSTCQIKKSKNHYCSKSCANTRNNKLYPKRDLQGICFLCGGRSKSIDRKCKDCKEKTKIDLKNLKLSEMDNYYPKTNRIIGWKNSKIRDFCRTWNSEFADKPCYNCGYNKHVELAHIKPISEFSQDSTIGEINHQNNIKQLCPNCHWEFDNGFLILPSL